jgi:hypothetical protein
MPPLPVRVGVGYKNSLAVCLYRPRSLPPENTWISSALIIHIKYTVLYKIFITTVHLIMLSHLYDTQNIALIPTPQIALKNFNKYIHVSVIYVSVIYICTHYCKCILGILLCYLLHMQVHMPIWMFL